MRLRGAQVKVDLRELSLQCETVHINRAIMDLMILEGSYLWQESGF